MNIEDKLSEELRAVVSSDKSVSSFKQQVDGHDLRVTLNHKRVDGELEVEYEYDAKLTTLAEEQIDDLMAIIRDFVGSAKVDEVKLASRGYIHTYEL